MIILSACGWNSTKVNRCVDIGNGVIACGSDVGYLASIALVIETPLVCLLLVVLNIRAAVCFDTSLLA